MTSLNSHRCIWLACLQLPFRFVTASAVGGMGEFATSTKRGEGIGEGAPANIAILTLAVADVSQTHQPATHHIGCLTTTCRTSVYRTIAHRALPDRQNILNVHLPGHRSQTCFQHRKSAENILRLFVHEKFGVTPLKCLFSNLCHCFLYG